MNFKNDLMAQLGWTNVFQTNLPAAIESIPRLVCDSVLRCESEIQYTLLANMVDFLFIYLFIIIIIIIIIKYMFNIIS